MTATTMAELVEFFDRHFGNLDGASIEIRGFHRGRAGGDTGGDPPRVQEFCASAEEAAEVAWRIRDRYDTFYGINPRVPGQGGKQGVTRIQCLHADVDYKIYGGDQRATLEALAGFELEPSVCVATGGGLQAYWYLDAPMPATAEMVNYVESLALRLYYRLGGLDRVQDISRVFRVPGTWNYKAAYERPEVRVVYRGPRTYSLPELEGVLPLLPAREYEPAETVKHGTPPSLEELRGMLRHIDPLLPYNEWVSVLMAIHSAYPGEDGLALADEWSTQAREDAGCNGTLLKQPEKWHQFRRSGGPGSIGIGTLVKMAQEGGWERPQGLKLVHRERVTPDQALDWQRTLAEYPPLTRDEQPEWMRRLAEHLEPYTTAWEADWPEMLALTSFAQLLTKCKFQNLGLNLWFLGVAPQGSGKSRSTGEMFRVIRETAAKQEGGLKVMTGGSPEGIIQALDGVNVSLLCYHSEYAGFLATLRKEWAKGMKDVLCDLYDGTGSFEQKKGSPVEAIDPYVGVIATTTPAAIVQEGSRRDLQNGYLSRFLFAVPDSLNMDNGGYRTDLERRELVEALFLKVVSLGDYRHARFDTPFGQDPPALVAYKQVLGIGTGEVRTFEDALLDEDMPAGRLVARVKKVATLLEMMGEPRTDPQHPDTILVGERAVAPAIRVVQRGDAYGKRLARALGASRDDEVAKHILRHLGKHKEGLTVREFTQLTHLDKKFLMPAIEMLVESGRLEQFTAGRRKFYKAV